MPTNLESVEEAVRVAAVRDIRALTSSLSRACALEALAHGRRVVRDSLYGLPVWRYAHGDVLFETDKPAVHNTSSIEAYVFQIHRLDALLRLPGSEKLDPETLFCTQDHEAVAGSSYGTWRKQYNEALDAAKKILNERTEESSGLFQCPKCKSFQVDTEQKQTRSADEPMTIFCHCVACATRFVR